MLYFAGHSLFHFNKSDEADMLELNTIIFNTFVWMQIFNQFNCRRLDNKFNILEGIHKNKWFFVINLIMVGGQILIIFVSGTAFGVTRLSGWQWGVSLGFAVFCIPWAAILKLAPDTYVEVLLEMFAKVIRCVFAWIVKGCEWIILVVTRCFHAVTVWSKMGRRRVVDEESASGIDR